MLEINSNIIFYENIGIIKIFLIKNAVN